MQEQESGGTAGKQVVLTKPCSLEGDGDDNFRAPRLIQQILSLFKHLRPGSDLAHFQVLFQKLLNSDYNRTGAGSFDFRVCDLGIDLFSS